MTGKEDLTISCSHLMVALRVLADWKINLKGVVPPAFGRRGLCFHNFDIKYFTLSGVKFTRTRLEKVSGFDLAGESIYLLMSHKIVDYIHHLTYDLRERTRTSFGSEGFLHGWK